MSDKSYIYLVTSNFQISFCETIHRKFFSNANRTYIGSAKLNYPSSKSVTVFKYKNLFQRLQIKAFIKEKSNTSIFFIPHMHTYLSSAILKYTKAERLNVFYEGFSSLVDEKISWKETLKFKLISFIFFKKSKIQLKSRNIMPTKSSFNKFYSPLRSKLYDDDKQIDVPYFNEKLFTTNEKVIVVGGEVFLGGDDSFVNRLYELVAQNFKDMNCFLKPHGRDDRVYGVSNFTKILDKNLMVESIIEEVKPSIYVSFCSSSLVHIKKMYPSVKVIFIYAQSLNNENNAPKYQYLEDLGIERLVIDA